MAHDIPVRKSPFGFDHVIDPVWHPEQHEWSHMLNGASLTMPYLEPFLNRTLREAADHIDDEDLLADIKGFIGQEAQHFQTHRRYNEGLKAAGHAELAEVERGYEADYARLAKRSLALRLAYCAGFETMTMGMTEWLAHDRIRLFRGGDPTVASFSLWHMVEETEHKSVAFDVFQAVSGSYLLRVAGLLHGSFHVAFMARRAYIAMLKKDGLWYRPQSRLRAWGALPHQSQRRHAALATPRLSPGPGGGPRLDRGMAGGVGSPRRRQRTPAGHAKLHHPGGVSRPRCGVGQIPHQTTISSRVDVARGRRESRPPRDPVASCS